MAATKSPIHICIGLSEMPVLIPWKNKISSAPSLATAKNEVKDKAK